MVFCNCLRRRHSAWSLDAGGPECLSVVPAACDAAQGDPSAPHLGPMVLTAPHWKVVLVFPRLDGVCETWQTACGKRGMEVATVSSHEQAMKQVASQLPHLLVIDGRSSRSLVPANLARSVKASIGPTNAPTILTVVKKNFSEKESSSVVTLLENGVNRLVNETCSTAVVTAELLQLERGAMLAQLQQRALQAVFAALDSCKDAVHITDGTHKIQYINKSCEMLLGYTPGDVLGRNIWEVHGSDNHRQEIRGHELRKQQQQQQQQQQPQQQQQQGVSTELCNRAFDSKSEHMGKTWDAKAADLATLTETSNNGHRQLERQESKVGLDISEAINLQLRRGREWEGVVVCRRKSGDVVHLPSKVVPINSRRGGGGSAAGPEFVVYCSSGGSVTPYATYGTERTHDTSFHGRGSVKSIRKTSYDIRSLNSDGSSHNPARRQSLAKLHTLTIEAPITRVISIITAAQENSPVYVSQALEKVLEILRSKELYSPQLVPNTEAPKTVPADPVATDLLGALLSHSPTPLASGRRCSNDHGTKPQSTRPNLSSLPLPATSEIAQHLTDDNSWCFDILRLEQLTEKRPLVWLGLSLMCQMNVPATLNCDEQTLQNWLTVIEANYHADNSYHNSTHAADVLHATTYFMQRPRIADLLDPLDVAAAMIAAVVHDVDHPGKNSAFLCNTNNDLAILYNDTSVLESHHSALSFKLTHTDARVNIYKGLDRDTYKDMRKSVVDMVLATDMTKHFEHLSKFVNMLDKCSMKRDDLSQYDTVGETLNVAQLRSSENQLILRRMLIKCADVSNPLRPLNLCVEWGSRIANEYFSQTEEEKKLGLPIVMPQFDRATCSIPKSQIGFIDFFISDMFEQWDALADIPECMAHLRANYEYWQKQQQLEEQRSQQASGPPTGGTATTPLKEEEEENGSAVSLTKSTGESDKAE